MNPDQKCVIVYTGNQHIEDIVLYVAGYFTHCHHIKVKNGVVLPALKETVVCPLLKSSALDLTDYFPLVSIFSFREGCKESGLSCEGLS